ncbi:Metalloenzyme, LuxS/M16 peptidase-like protein [Amylostereum chailletii]|nr:Metalloenzyme, LuxS/M16 peptidase-like protein [Amylostereum chailletii]
MLRASRLARTSARGFATVVDAANGLKVAAVDNGQPTSSVTVLLKAGSRYESKPGVAHVLSNFAFKSTGKRSALGTVREAELYGGVLSSTLTREHLALTADFLRGDEAFFVDVLATFLASAKFTRHELAEYVFPAVAAESEAASHSAPTRALELAHALAFRNGLGNSLYATPESAADISPEDVRALHAQALSTIAVLGTGIAPDTLVSLFEKSFAAARAKSAAPAVDAPASPASTYHGGSTRIANAHGPQALFVGFGTTSAAQFPALQALAAYLSPSPSVKWGAGAGPLAAVPAGVSARTVTLPYSDAALFGLLVEGADAAKLRDVAKKAVDVLKAAAGGVAKEDAARAVAKARFAVASALERKDEFVGGLGPAVLKGESANGQSAVDAVAAVDGPAISKVAADILKGKPTFVAVGDAYKLPYGDEVGLANA